MPRGSRLGCYNRSWRNGRGKSLAWTFVGRFAPAEGTEKTHCLLIVDKFTKYVMLEAVHETVTAEQTAEVFIRRVIANHGVPSMVISDRGPQFAARLWKDTLSLMGSTTALATTHHPQTDGQSERAIQTFLRLLRSFAYQQEDQWEKYLPFFQYAINDSYCDAICSTPFRLLYGMDPVSPFPLRTDLENEETQPTESISPLSRRDIGGPLTRGGRSRKAEFRLSSRESTSTTADNVGLYT